MIKASLLAFSMAQKNKLSFQWAESRWPWNLLFATNALMNCASAPLMHCHRHCMHVHACRLIKQLHVAY